MSLCRYVDSKSQALHTGVENIRVCHHNLSMCYNEYPPILSCQLMVEVSYKISVAAVPRLAF